MTSLPNEVYKLDVDKEDLEKMSAFSWYFDPHTGYMRRTLDGMSLHVFLCGRAPKGSVWDHKNRNKLDNKRENLRLVTHSQSMINRNVGHTGSSKFRGVFWVSRLSKWVAQIKVNGKKKHLGCFELEEDAALAYDTAARSLHGEFAQTNFPLS